MIFFFFSDTDAKALMKERQKKDNHNLSESSFISTSLTTCDIQWSADSTPHPCSIDMLFFFLFELALSIYIMLYLLSNNWLVKVSWSVLLLLSASSFLLVYSWEEAEIQH